MNESKLYHCGNCEGSFKLRQSSFKHELKYGNDIVFHLSFKTCNYQTTLKDTLLSHSRICRRKKPLLKCKSCNLSFKYRSDLLRCESIHKKWSQKTPLAKDLTIKIILISILTFVKTNMMNKIFIVKIVTRNSELEKAWPNIK